MLLLLLGCSEDPKLEDDTAAVVTEADADTDTDTDTDADSTPCIATLVSITPADDAVDVPADTTVVATYDAAVTAEDITLELLPVSEAGVPLPATVVIAEDGLSATLTLDSELARDSEYEVLASVCDVPTGTNFFTVGEPQTLDVTGRTFDVDFGDNSDIEWVAPVSGALLLSQVQTDHLLFMVEAMATEIDMVGAAGIDAGRDPRQATCAAAVDFPPAPFDANPYFSIGPVDAAITASGILVPLFGLAVSGVIAPDGESLDSLVLRGVLDVGPVSAVLGYDACELVESFGDTCVTCPFGGETCLVMEVHDERARWVEDLVLDPDLVAGDEC